MEKNGGCDQRCINSPGSFNCLCNVGFDLYSENSTAGFDIPQSETGLKDDDVYRINKTCVRKFYLFILLYFYLTQLFLYYSIF